MLIVSFPRRGFNNYYSSFNIFGCKVPNLKFHCIFSPDIIISVFRMTVLIALLLLAMPGITFTVAEEGRSVIIVNESNIKFCIFAKFENIINESAAKTLKLNSDLLFHNMHHSSSVKLRYGIILIADLAKQVKFGQGVLGRCNQREFWGGWMDRVFLIKSSCFMPGVFNTGACFPPITNRALFIIYRPFARGIRRNIS